MLVDMVIIFSSGIDEMLSQHIAHLFIRDPISLFSEKIHQDDNEDVDHFEVRERNCSYNHRLQKQTYYKLSLRKIT